MGYSVNVPSTQDNIVEKAVGIASEGCNEINLVLSDIKDDSYLTGNSDTNETNGASDPSWKVTDTVTGHKDNDVLDKYGITLSDNLNISQASGAMVIDDLMQKISTKVQVAAQLLSSANNINKTVSRIMSQG